MLRRVGAFVVAAAVMVVLGSAVHSYFVQEAWSTAAGDAGGTAPVVIPFVERVSWARHDLVGMVVPYGVIISIALCIAFLAAGAVARFTGRRVIVGFFGACGAIGLAAQMVAGLVAGMLFGQLTLPRKPAGNDASGVI
jgi:hypothetical protein